MSEDENNVDGSSGVPIDTRVGTNSKKTRTPHVIPITDSSPALENVYQSFRIVVKLYAFQTTNVTDQRVLSTWLLKYDKATKKPLRHKFIKRMLLASHLYPSGHNTFFKLSASSKPLHKELNGVIKDKVTQNTDGDARLSTLDRGNAVGPSQVFARKSFQLMMNVTVLLEEDTCRGQKTPLESDEQVENLQVNETFPDRRIRIALDPRLIAKTVVVHVMYPTDNGLRSRENTKNLNADHCVRKRPDCHVSGPRSDSSPETEARKQLNYGGGKNAAAENADDTLSKKRECPGGKFSPQAVAASPYVVGEPCERPVDDRYAVCGCDDDGGASRTSGAPVLRPTLKSLTKLWHCSRIRAGSDLTSGKNGTQGQNKGRAPGATGIRNNSAQLVQLRRVAARGRNLGGAVTRSTQGPAEATTYMRAPVKPRDPPVRIDRPVQLYERSRLPVPIRSTPPPPRIPRPVRLLDRDWKPAALYPPSTDRSSDRTCSFTLTGTIRLNDLPATTDSCTILPPQQVSQVKSSLNIHDTDAFNLDRSIGSRPPSMDDRSPGLERDNDVLPDLSAGSLGPMTLSEDALDLTNTRPRSRAKSAENRDYETHG